MEIKKEFTDLAIWATIAGMGGAARFLTQRLAADALPLTMGRTIFQLSANCFISGFSGFMGALLMSAFSPEPKWVWAAAGIFGYLGPAGMDILADKISKKFD